MNFDSVLGDRYLHIEEASEITPILEDVHCSGVSSNHKWLSSVNMKHLYNKLAPYGTDGRLLLTANFKVMWHKLGQKSGPDTL